ncbi:hypothetical protein LguiA_023991 [Lonicera macranthoides]
MNTRNINQQNEKKIMRRDIEKKRRQEMATLCSSLRSHLPHDIIKGKRSIVDHIAVATNYIKYLQNNMKELRLKRDYELNNISYNTAALCSGSGSSCGYTSSCVMVYPILGGVKIVFTNGFDEEKLHLSRVVSLLLQERVDVVSCVSAKVNEKLLHTIHCEVTDLTDFSLSDLQQKLNAL